MKKMIAIDIGNTETTVGIGNKDGWNSYRFTTRDANTSDELLVLFNSTFELDIETKNQISGSIICSVVPQVTNNMVKAIEKYLESSPIVVGPGVKTGLKVNIDNPKELGPDRIANSVAGYKIAESDVIIVDLGTATTFDVVNSKKEYLGGSIAPGIKISLDALTSKTASLKSVELDLPKKVIGKNTYEAIQSGLIYGHASMIDSMIEKLLQELGTKPKIILTGGLSKTIQPALNLNASYEQDLTLIGLEEIFNLNN
jgi:type III pantothenate kinase